MTHTMWCLHCERVSEGNPTPNGPECSYRDCDGSAADAYPWRGDYDHGKVYEMYSPDFMRGVLSDE